MFKKISLILIGVAITIFMMQECSYAWVVAAVRAAKKLVDKTTQKESDKPDLADDNADKDAKTQERKGPIKRIGERLDNVCAPDKEKEASSEQ